MSKPKGGHKAAREAKKETRRKIYRLLNAAIGTIIVLAVAVAVLLASGLPQRYTTVLTVGNKKVSARELNYYFRDSYDDFRSAYSDYIEQRGIIDSSVDLDKQEYSEGCTWAQFFYDTCRTTVIRTQIMLGAAEDENWDLTDRQRQTVEDKLQELEDYADKNNMGINKFLSSFYGRGANVTTYREYLEKKALAESYSKHIYALPDFSESELEEYFQKNYPYSQDEYDYATVNFREIFFKYDYAYDDSAENYGYSEQSKSEALEKARSVLSEYESGEQTESEFASLADKYSQNGSLEFGLYENAMKDDEAIEACVSGWIFNEERFPGSTVCMEGEYGAYVLYWCGRDVSAGEYLSQTGLRDEAWNERYNELENAVTISEKEDVLKYLWCKP